jgi:hypothetical protein
MNILAAKFTRHSLLNAFFFTVDQDVTFVHFLYLQYVSRRIQFKYWVQFIGQV